MLIRRIFTSQLRLNMLSGPISTGMGLVISAAKYPLYLHFLGYSQYGVWLLLSTVMSFAQMGLLGITPAITKVIAEEYGCQNYDKIQQYFITAIVIAISIGSLMVVTSFYFRQEFVTLLGVEGSSASLVKELLVYMVLFSVGVMIYQIINAMLAGVGRMDLANYSQTILQILPLAVAIPLLLLGKGVVSLLLANAFAYLTVFLLNYFRLKSLTDIRLFSVKSFSLDRAKALLGFGGTIFAGTMLNMAVLPITKIVITRSTGIEDVPIFEVAYRTALQVRSLFEVSLRALMPEISKLSNKKENNQSNKTIQSLEKKSYKLLLIIAPPLYIMLYLLSDTIFKIWLGAEYTPQIAHIFRILLLVSFISLIGVIAYYSAMGRGNARLIFIHFSLSAGGTLSLLSVIIQVNPTLSNISSCFLFGAFLGTTYLLIKRNHDVV